MRRAHAFCGKARKTAKNDERGGKRQRRGKILSCIHFVCARYLRNEFRIFWCGFSADSLPGTLVPVERERLLKGRCVRLSRHVSAQLPRECLHAADGGSNKLVKLLLPECPEPMVYCKYYALFKIRKPSFSDAHSDYPLGAHSDYPLGAVTRHTSRARARSSRWAIRAEEKSRRR